MTDTIRIDGARLRQARREQLRTQKQVAESAGVDEKTVISAEAGKPILITTAARLVKALRLNPSDVQVVE